MVEIDTLIKQNPWWKHGSRFKTYDKHLMELEQTEVKFRRKFLTFKPNNIYVIRGPRQSGKTVWIKQTILNLLENKIDPESIFYLSCDSLTSASRKELRRAIDFFLSQSERFEEIYLFLDEVTYVKDWMYEVKSLADQGILLKAVLVVTGSRPERLKEFAPGRGVERNEYFLKPLSFREFVLQVSERISVHEKRPERMNALQTLKDRLEACSSTLEDFSDIKSTVSRLLPFNGELSYLFKIYIKTGGFPRAINNYLKNFFRKKEIIEDAIYETYIRIIVGDIKEEKSEILTKQILNSVIRKYGTRYSYQTITKNGEGLTHPTVIDYLELFKDAFLLHILYSYDFNKNMFRPKANKKIYFADPFIYYAVDSWLKGISGYELTRESLLKEGKIATLIEGIVATHLTRIKEEPFLKDPETFLWFYYNSRREIDFVYKRGSKNYLGLEVKYQYSVSPLEIQKINEIKEYVVLTKGESELKGNTIFIPVAAFLAILKPSAKHL